MSTLVALAGISIPIITYVIGRYLSPYNATVKLATNVKPHHAADKQYIAVYPSNGIEPAHFTVEEYQHGVKRLKDHPEDKIN